jgi:CRISPR-associated protein Csd1
VPPKKNVGQEEKAKLDNYTQLRYGIIRATLNRQFRRDNLRHKEITVSLDMENTEIGYLFGRLFATLERLQEVAIPGVRASIRDRYFASASMRPGTVFPSLIALSNHHAAKAKANGRDYGLEREKSRILDQIPPTAMSRVLDLTQQGLFALGYYHQRENFFKKKDTVENLVEEALTTDAEDSTDTIAE